MPINGVFKQISIILHSKKYKLFTPITKLIHYSPRTMPVFTVFYRELQLRFTEIILIITMLRIVRPT
jgi:hypothetical protein